MNAGDVVEKLAWLENTVFISADSVSERLPLNSDLKSTGR